MFHGPFFILFSGHLDPTTLAIVPVSPSNRSLFLVWTIRVAWDAVGATDEESRGVVGETLHILWCGASVKGAVSTHLRHFQPLVGRARRPVTNKTKYNKSKADEQ